MRLDPLTLTEYESIARLRLSTDSWEYIRGGEIDERTVARNDAAFDDLLLRPQHLRDSGDPSLSTTMLGTPVALPVFLSPSAGHFAAHPLGEIATVAGAEAAGTVMIASTETNVPIGEIAASSTAPLWFALHHMTRDLTAQLVTTARAAGCRAVVVGVDDPLPHAKLADLRVQYRAPEPFGNLAGVVSSAIAHAASDSAEPALRWSDLVWVRSA